ncbi:MAG: acetolactate synthase-1/2/3 large subunit [Cellvibrionaceae bacterium]|jgi:acetolactate synthase-1/2/3 large subunit
MQKMTGGEAVVKSLIKHGVHTLFGLPGVQNDWLYNALYDHQDQIRVIHTRHEQGAAYMALGYAMATGGPAVYSIVPGPGFLNSSAALATAYGLNAKVFCLSGQIPTHVIGKELGVLHEINDQLGIMRKLTKWSERANSPAEAAMLVDEAFRQMDSGRPRPVGLEVPMDVLSQRGAVDLDQPMAEPFAPAVDTDRVEKAADWLGNAKFPMIYVGSGAIGASEAVRELAEALQAPVVGYRTGMGIMDGRHPLSLHLPPSHEYWKKTDLVLAIGSNLRVPAKWGKDENLKIVQIDVDPTAHGKHVKPDLTITARAEDVMPLLVERTAVYNNVRPSINEEMQQIKQKWAADTAYLEMQNSYLRLIRSELGEEGIFVDELTQVGFASRITYPVYKPHTFVSTGYQGTLGYGFATALGVKVAKPNVPVISVAGDGGFMFTMQELATAVQHKIGLVTLIFNNNSYGNVQQMQKELYGNRVIASDLVNPDFVAMAKAFGANGYRAETLDECRDAIRKGFESDLPTIIEVPVGDVPSIDRFRTLGKVR